MVGSSATSGVVVAEGLTCVGGQTRAFGAGLYPSDECGRKAVVSALAFDHHLGREDISEAKWIAARCIQRSLDRKSHLTKSHKHLVFVACARVSTTKQGQNGLGLETQEATIQGFLWFGDRLLAPMLVEAESGKRTDRPEVEKALEKCRVTGATLLIAKLDCLARCSLYLGPHEAGRAVLRR